MPGTITIERRFHGPPQSANGGYACGLLAAHLEPDPAVEVTLRAPPPLDRPLTVDRAGDSARLLDGDVLVAEASPAPDPGLELPEPVTLEQAERAREGSPFHREHAFPECFVCGPRREPGDGLRVVAGPVPGRELELLAAPWETAEWMAGPDGRVRPELIWAVLDCPGGLAGFLEPDIGVIVLGRLTARLLAPVEPGPSYVALGWRIARDGRKLYSGSAVLAEDGSPLALARGTWIELREQPA